MNFDPVSYSIQRVDRVEQAAGADVAAAPAATQRVELTRAKREAKARLR